ncbi:hypothetical protein [Paraburkholderia sp. PGU16]|jgi:hypothetical protein|uniref:Membrane protein n=1 Tax=Paraburkholderia largidicola TaxID=3014751 RepID=A0A7I8BM13_9BURK|nr:hypothetical protein [Paraburkholderia sp. PGU16]BCF89535.1 membrane protein [Paraburkholderia sp. PGU16]BEU22499.1 membrane protein [Paraburkholderia sp. 22B1P]
MSDNTYKFQDHYNLSPPELFLFIALDQTKRQLGFADLAAVATWLLGVNDVPVPGKPITATPGTSVMSLFFRNVITKKTKMPLPTLTMKSFSTKGVRLIYTRSLGAFIGRAIPVVDLMFMGYDATLIMYRSVQRYNAMVKREDQLG